MWCLLSHWVKRSFGSGLFTELKYLMAIFHYMPLDDTILTVLATVKQILDKGNVTSLDDAINLALDMYDKNIVKKVREAEKRISERIISSISSGSGMYLNPYHK